MDEPKEQSVLETVLATLHSLPDPRPRAEIVVSQLCPAGGSVALVGQNGVEYWWVNPADMPVSGAPADVVTPIFMLDTAALGSLRGGAKASGLALLFSRKMMEIADEMRASKVC
jgi:hypothetical protein